MKVTTHIAVALVAVLIMATAMPTKVEVDRGEPKVTELLKAHNAAAEFGRIGQIELAKIAMEKAGSSSYPAQKLLLCQAACKLYVDAGEFDAAFEVINDVPA